MKNQKVSAVLGIIVVVIFTITAAVFVWQVIRNREVVQMPQKVVTMKESVATQTPATSQQNQPVNTGQEFPSIPVQPGVSLEDMMKQAFYEKYPDWKDKNYSVTVTVETNQENHAIGRFTYDGYNIVKDGKYHSTGDGIWFAAESNNSWTLAVVSGVGYNGTCQIFKKYKFADMTPDCWDTEKNILVDTLNPQMFYRDGFTKVDKKKIVQAFISFVKTPDNYGHLEPSPYLNKDLYVRIDKNTENYLNGTMLIGGSKNISAPYFLAVKQDGIWKVVFNGQDIPNCNVIEPYNFPHEIIDKCYDEQNKQEKTVS